MRGGLLHRPARLALTAAVVGSVTLFVPLGSASADTLVPGGDHADAGEGTGDLLAAALREATPEELEARRADIAERLEAAGSAEEFMRRLESDSLSELADLDRQLGVAQSALVEAREAATAAEAALAEARDRRTAATERAEDADAALRSAAVDMFINPPKAHSVRAALSGTVEKEMAATNLLAGRTQSRREVAERRDRARSLALEAQRDARRATRNAHAATANVTEATEKLTDRIAERSRELARIHEQLAVVRDELADLHLTDSVLATRLALDTVARSGSVTVVRGPGGELIPSVHGLPTRADMVRIGSTGVWVHHLVAPNVFTMFMAAFTDGVTLDGSAFRDSLRQIELRAAHCGSSYEAMFLAPPSSCSPPTARPGESMHQRGLAIDFTEGGRTLTRTSEAFRWLSEHAHEYGFFNLPSEPWHWSVNGR